MTFYYHENVINDLKLIDQVQAHMLIDYFENQYDKSVPIKKGRLFRTGPFRIIFIEEDDKIKVLRIIR